MNDQPALDQLVTDWLRADAPPRAPQVVLAASLERVAGVGQELPLGGRRFDAWIGRSPRMHWAIVGALLAVALLGAVAGAGALLGRAADPAHGVTNGWVAHARHSLLGSQDARSTPMDIFLVREGAEPHRIAGSDDVFIRAVCPSFSPDGTRLAYAEATEVSDLINNSYAWDQRAIIVQGLGDDGLPSGRAARIAASQAGGDTCPEWSPDGRALAFLTGDPADLGIVSGTSAITQPDAYDGEFRPIARALRIARLEPLDFAWSPDGAVIAIAGRSGIWLVPVDGGPPRQLETGSARSLSWSPDGSRIAFATDEQEPLIRVLDVAGGITRDLGPGFGPAWSPDGRRIAYERIIDPVISASEIVVVDPDGTDPHVIDLASLGSGAATSGTRSGVVWAPDGSRILFVGTLLTSVSATGDPAAIVFPTGQTAISDTALSWQPVVPR